MAFELKKIDRLSRDSVDGFMAGLTAADGRLTGSMAKYSHGLQALKEHLYTMETDPPRLMPNSTLWFMCEGDEILGAIEVRHFLNDGLLRYGGHIGYVVAAQHRGKGYAATMLEMIKPELAKLKLDMVLICAQEDNIASVKSIEKAGGVLENAVEIIRDGKKKVGLRYWMEIQP